MLEHFLRRARRRRMRAALLRMTPRSRLPHASRPQANLRLPTLSVYILAPEQSLRLALARTLWLAGVDARSFDGARSFVAALPELDPGCLLLDIAALEPANAALPAGFGWCTPGWPIVLMLGRLDAEETVRAIRLGASDVLRKPVAQDELLDALGRAAGKLRQQRLYNQSIRARRAMDGLSARERDVVEALKDGLSSKEIARQLGLSHRTVEMYRNNIHRKLGVTSLAQLLKIAWLAAGLEEQGGVIPAAA
jgi:FixJ family two-component response regulator